MIFILWTLHQISTISEIDNLLFCHGRFWPTIFWLGLSQQITSIVSNLYKFVHIGLWIVTYYWEHLRKISCLLPAKNCLFGQFHWYFSIRRRVTSMGGELPLYSAVRRPGLWTISVTLFKVGHVLRIFCTRHTFPHFNQIFLILQVGLGIHELAEFSNQVLPVLFLDMVVIGVEPPPSWLKISLKNKKKII